MDAEYSFRPQRGHVLIANYEHAKTDAGRLEMLARLRLAVEKRIAIIEHRSGLTAPRIPYSPTKWRDDE